MLQSQVTATFKEGTQKALEIPRYTRMEPVVFRTTTAPSCGDSQVVSHWNPTKHAVTETTCLLWCQWKAVQCCCLHARKEPEWGNCDKLCSIKVESGPSKETLPQLELMGALIGNNLLKFLKMEKNQLRMWTDSMITLYWIRTTAHKWEPFVENRLTEIQSLTNPETRSHINGKNNPADLPTRGQSVDNLIQSQELNLLKLGQELDKDSKIKDLKPFLDENSLISEGGRLQQSRVQFQRTAPLGASPQTQIHWALNSKLPWKGDAFWGQGYSSADKGELLDPEMQTTG